MDIYTLDGNYELNEVIDQYESFIWTERYDVMGDFELVVPPTARMRSLLVFGRWLIHGETRTPMQVRTVNRRKDDEGKTMLFVKGYSFEYWFQQRALRPNAVDSGTVTTVMYNLINKICVTGEGAASGALDIFPDFRVFNNASSSDTVEVKFQNKNLYEILTSLAESVDVGFEVVLGNPAAKLSMSIYRGTTRSGVIFSSELDTLTNEEYLLSDANYKNLAFVTLRASSDPDRIGEWIGSTDSSGFSRRILIVDGTDIDPADFGFASDKWYKAISQRGKEALAEHRRVNAIDGKIPHQSIFQYRADYFMGDLVTFRGEGVEEQRRVTEYIWVSDGEGDRSYPTLEAV